MTFYQEMADLAADLLSSDEFGEAGHIRRINVMGGGPSDKSGGITMTTDYPCQLAAFPVDERDVDGELVKAGDFRVLVAPLEIVPTTTDKVVCSQGLLTIIDAGQFDPAGAVTHYRMLARVA